MPDVPVGADCKTYRNTGNFGTPVWNEITIIVDLTLNDEYSEADSSSRVSNYGSSEPAIKRQSVDFNIRHIPSADDYDALRAAYNARNTIDMAFADGNIAASGTRYFRTDMKLHSWNRGQPLEEVMTIDITAKHCFSLNAPGDTTVP